MQFRLLIFLVIVHVVSSFIPRNGSNETNQCDEGSTEKMNANKQGPCIPGELVWVDCNLCTCNQRGMPNHICANMWCQPQPKGKGMTTEMPYEDEEEENVEANEA